MANTIKAAKPAPARARKTTPPPAKTTPARKATAPAATAPARKAPAAPAGWYPDLDDPTLTRYWDGEAWLGAALPASIVEGDTAPPPPAAGDVPAQKKGDDWLGIVFRDRRMATRRLTAEMAGVWERIGNQYSPELFVAPPGETDEQALARKKRRARIFSRALTVIMSVLVDDADKEWVEDQMLEGRLDFADATTIVTKAVDAFAASLKDRAPTTGPPAKARRRR